MGLKLNFIPEASMLKAPQAFEDLLTAVGANFATYPDDATMNIVVGYGTINSGPLPSNDLAASFGNRIDVTKDQWGAVKERYAARATAPAQKALLAMWPDDPLGLLVTSRFQQKLLGMIDPHDTTIDGWIGVGRYLPHLPNWSYTNRAVPGEFCMAEAVEHEITERMGRDCDTDVGTTLTILDMARWQAPGVRCLTYVSTAEPYFSLDSGKTKVNPACLWCDYNWGRARDLMDWYPTPGSRLSPFCAVATLGAGEVLQGFDFDVLRVVGLHPPG